ncbi:MAG: aminotransferase class I/II-fold pyridoxal phosphate-dependent enzyme [Nakamurella sp.]
MTEFAARIDAVTPAELRAVGSRKWTVPADGEIGAFIAEMDFGVAQPVQDAVRGLLDSGNTGYVPVWMDAEFSGACAEFQQAQFGWHVDPANVHSVSDVLKVMEIALDYFTRPGGAVILPTPAYMPFFEVAPAHGRRIIEVPCHNDNGYFTLDLDGIDAAFEAGGEMLVLCNPHNPVGRVLSRTELEAVCAIVAKHGGGVFADEIHAPITYADSPPHIPYASINEVAASHTLTGTSASKAFNLPGLKCAAAIVSNDRDARIWRTLPDVVTHSAATIGVAANIAAYREGGPWFAEVLEYLSGNRAAFAEQVSSKLPGVTVRPPDGSYLSWLDFRGYGLNEQAAAWVHREAGVMLNEGSTFGAPGVGFARLNMATPRPILTEIIDRIATALARR